MSDISPIFEKWRERFEHVLFFAELKKIIPTSSAPKELQRPTILEAKRNSNKFLKIFKQLHKKGWLPYKQFLPQNVRNAYEKFLSELHAPDWIDFQATPVKKKGRERVPVTVSVEIIRLFWLAKKTSDPQIKSLMVNYFESNGPLVTFITSMVVSSNPESNETEHQTKINSIVKLLPVSPKQENITNWINKLKETHLRNFLSENSNKTIKKIGTKEKAMIDNLYRKFEKDFLTNF